MTLTTQTARTARRIFLLAALFITIFCNPLSTKALGSVVDLPSLMEFSRSVQNGQAGVLRGVYVADVLALPIVQQPAGNAGYVSTNDDELTQFRMASQFGNVGLLAHNHLSGKLFSQIALGQEVQLVYGDGKTESFIVTEVLQYQALKPNSPYSDFRNVNDNKTLTAEQMFKRVYFGDRHITFQTCIAKDGNVSWGRLFIVAIPIAEYEKLTDLP